jgi:hypothetical protein
MRRSLIGRAQAAGSGVIDLEPAFAAEHRRTGRHLESEGRCALARQAPWRRRRGGDGERAVARLPCERTDRRREPLRAFRSRAP